MKHGLWGASNLVGAEEQKAALADFGVAADMIRGPKDRDWIINKRTRSHDRIAVYRLFVIATNVGELQDCVARAHDRGIYFDEVKSKRRSDKTKELLEMMQDAQLAYGGRWLDPERAAEMGLRARGLVNGGKPKKRMPNAEAEVILNDLSLTIPEALHVINSDKNYKLPWSRSFIYRQRKKRRLKLKRRHNGDGW